MLGNPAQPPTIRAMANLTVDLPPDVHRRLRIYALEQQQTLSAALADILDQCLVDTRDPSSHVDQVARL